MSTAVAPMKFSDRLLKLRLDARLTQQEAADRARMPLGTYRNYEQGRRPPNWMGLFRLARALGVSAEAFGDCDELISNEPDAPPPPRPRGRPRKPAG